MQHLQPFEEVKKNIMTTPSLDLQKAIIAARSDETIDLCVAESMWIDSKSIRFVLPPNGDLAKIRVVPKPSACKSRVKVTLGYMGQVIWETMTNGTTDIALPTINMLKLGDHRIEIILHNLNLNDVVVSATFRCFHEPHLRHQIATLKKDFNGSSICFYWPTPYEWNDIVP